MGQTTAGQSFIVNGKQYSIQLEYRGDFLDPAFFRFIEQVTAETISDGKFYILYEPVIYEQVGYLFLTEDQRTALTSEGFILLDSLDDVSKRQSQDFEANPPGLGE